MCVVACTLPSQSRCVPQLNTRMCTCTYHKDKRLLSAQVARHCLTWSCFWAWSHRMRRLTYFNCSCAYVQVSLI